MYEDFIKGTSERPTGDDYFDPKRAAFYDVSERNRFNEFRERNSFSISPHRQKRS